MVMNPMVHSVKNHLKKHKSKKYKKRKTHHVKNPSLGKPTYEPGSKLLVLGMVIQPLIGNPYNGYINPYYWVDDHPLLYGNIGSLDPGTYGSFEENVKPLRESCST